MRTLTNDWQAINNIVVVVIDSALPLLYCANLYSLSIHIAPVTSCHCMYTYLVVGMFPCDGREWHYNCQSRNNECVLLTTYLESDRDCYCLYGTLMSNERILKMVVCTYREYSID